MKYENFIKQSVKEKIEGLELIGAELYFINEIKETDLGHIITVNITMKVLFNLVVVPITIDLNEVAYYVDAEKPFTELNVKSLWMAMERVQLEKNIPSKNGG